MSQATKPISERERQLLAMPSIASQFPVIFENGACWTELACACNICHKDIPPDLLRGTISRPVPSVVVVEAVGVCPDCRIATPFLYRMHDDMRITGPGKGQWQTWRPKLSLQDRLGRWLQSFGA